MGNINFTGKYVYGEPAESMPNERERMPLFQQPDKYSCGLFAQKIVLRDYGIDIPFDELQRMAVEKGFYHMNEGTYRDELGKALEMMGVGIHVVPNASKEALMDEFVKGHRVILSLDSNELWYNKTFMEKLGNKAADFLSPEQGNHALIAAGLVIDTDNPANSYVVLTDSGSGEFRVKYPLEQFMDAWKDSNCYMIATNDPAPYQYDSELDKMVPSNFAVNKHMEEYMKENSFALKSDQIYVPEGYQPAYENEYDFIHQYAIRLDLENNPQFKDFILNRDNKNSVSIAQEDKNAEEKQDSRTIKNTSDQEEHFDSKEKFENHEEEEEEEDPMNDDDDNDDPSKEELFNQENDDDDPNQNGGDDSGFDEVSDLGEF